MNWEDVYKNNCWKDTNQVDELKEIYRLIKETDRNIIDIGCGFGRISIPLAIDGYQMSCVDCVKKPLLKLKEKSKELDNLTTKVCNSTNLFFPDKTFDGAIAINSIYHNTYKNVLVSINEIKRVLKNNGWLYCTFLSKDDYKYGKGKKVNNNSYISIDGPDVGIEHVYFSEMELRNLFSDWCIVFIRQDSKYVNNLYSSHYTIGCLKV